MLLAAPFTALLFAISATAKPIQLNESPVTLALTRHLNLTSAHNLVRHDQARAKYLKSRTTNLNANIPDSGISSPVDNQAVLYVATIGVGTPPTDYNLVVDTGSSNTWVGANRTKPYVQTASSSATLNSSVRYGSGSFVGVEFIDTVTITPNLVIPNQSIGAATLAIGFSRGLDGILGIGPVDLTKNTVLGTNLGAEVPTVTDNLFSNGIISADTIGISFEPTTVPSVVNGEITWGGTDASKFTGDITYIPVTSSFPASNYWGIDQSIRYGESTTILSQTAGIVDTGSTLILLATDAFNAYQKATGAVPDSTTGLLTITTAQYAALSSLFFTTGGTTFELTPNAQIWPRTLNSQIGGLASNIYLIVNDIGSIGGGGLDFINGYGFLERFYSVYDTTNKRVGIATTPFTNAETN